jgi:hypothetical protein
MTQNIKSVQLTLMIGSAVATAAPREVIDALEEVEVQVEDTEASGFQMTFSIDKQSPLEILRLLAGGLLFVRVVLVATVNGFVNLLIDGVVTHNQYSPGDKGSNSTLTATGKDLTALMDHSNRSSYAFNGCPAQTRVATILKKYEIYGITPQIVPPDKSHTPSATRIPGQQGTDLQYMRSLAEKADHVFYLEPGPTPGRSTAYWGPRMREGPVQPALSVDMDAYNNVEGLHFSFDQEQNREPVVFNSYGKDGAPVSVSVPDSKPLDPQLARKPPKPANIAQDLIPFRDDLFKLPLGQAFLLGMAAIGRSREAVSCDGSLDVTRYGGILKARQLVAVRGSRPLFDGLYYVKSVKHKIKRGEYKQDFTLTRDGLGSTVKKVNV